MDAVRRSGGTVRSTIDCLIACLGAEHDYPILSKDRDFERILTSGHCAAKAFEPSRAAVRER